VTDSKDKVTQQARSPFPPLYWLVVVFEFFERGAYYGMMSVLSVYMTDELNFAKQDVGIIKAIIQPLLYFLPIITGALADRFGYRRTLMVAFSLLGGGYFLTSQATEYAWVFMALVVMGLGAGTFKPVISGTIARCTDSSNSTLGFGIFYWSINLGAFLFPLFLVPYLKNNIGWTWVIIASAICTGALLLPTALVFREPPAPKDADASKDKPNLLQTLANAFEIIYSSIILLHLSIKRGSTVAVVVVAVLLLGTLGGGLRGFFTPQTVQYKVTTRTYARGGEVPLQVTFKRDLTKAAPLKITRKKATGPNQAAPPPTLTIFNPTLMRQVLHAPAPAVPSQCAEDAAQEGQACAKCCDQVRAPWHAWSKASGCACRSVLDALHGFKGHGWVSAPDVKRMLADFDTRVYLSVTIDPDLSEPFVVSTTRKGRYQLTLASKAEGLAHKPAIMKRLHATRELNGLTEGAVTGKIVEAHRRPFGLLFAGMLILGGLVILRLSSWFKTATQGTKIVAVLATLGLYWGGVAALFAAGFISVIAVFVMAMVSPTVLALYVIDHGSGVDKFWDHFKFLTMIVIYAGFWVLYFQMFDSVLWYTQAYVDAASLNNAITGVLSSLGATSNWRFDVEHVTVINAMTIILLQLIVSNIVKNTRAMPTMITGIAMGTLGMAILAWSTGIWVLLGGIAIFSVGEMTAHPKLISYVGQTAPKSRVAMYMGYLFLYGVIGSGVGAPLGANLYVKFVDDLNQPRTLWLIFAGIGVATIVGLLIYNAVVNRGKKDTPEPEVSTS
jgi:dipeptide/tripeptide permease